MALFSKPSSRKSPDGVDFFYELDRVDLFFSSYFTDPVCSQPNVGWMAVAEKAGLTDDGEKWKSLRFSIKDRNVAVSRFSASGEGMYCTVAFDGWRTAFSSNMKFLLTACSCFFGSTCIQNLEKNYAEFQKTWTEVLWDSRTEVSSEKIPRFSLSVRGPEFSRLEKEAWVFQIV